MYFNVIGFALDAGVCVCMCMRVWVSLRVCVLVCLRAPACVGMSLGPPTL